jgi:hypothetical protein
MIKIVVGVIKKRIQIIFFFVILLVSLK